MSDRSIDVADIPVEQNEADRRDIVNKDRTPCIRLRVSYDEGGHNWYSGGKNPRCIKLVASLIHKGDGCYSCVIGKGIAYMLEPAPRFNRKRLELWASKIKTDERYLKAIAHVLQEEGRVRAGEAVASNG